MLILAYDENDNIVHIKDAEKGKSYRCPDCGAEVRPRKGTKKTHHFFHMNAEDCGNSGESIVHKFYKELIANQKTVQYNGVEMIVTNSKIEQTLPNLLTGSHIIADVMLELGGYKWIAVEVCYKNHKDENHVDIYNALDMECFEVYVDMNNNETDFIIKDYKCLTSFQSCNDFDEECVRWNKIAKKRLNELMAKQKEIDDILTSIKQSTGYDLQVLKHEYIDDIGKHYTYLQMTNNINFILNKNKNITDIVINRYEKHERHIKDCVFTIEFFTKQNGNYMKIKEIRIAEVISGNGYERAAVEAIKNLFWKKRYKKYNVQNGCSFFGFIQL